MIIFQFIFSLSLPACSKYVKPISVWRGSHYKMDGPSGSRFACKHPAVNIKNVNLASCLSHVFVEIFKIAQLEEELILTYQKDQQ